MTKQARIRRNSASLPTIFEHLGHDKRHDKQHRNLPRLHAAACLDVPAVSSAASGQPDARGEQQQAAGGQRRRKKENGEIAPATCGATLQG